MCVCVCVYVFVCALCERNLEVFFSAGRFFLILYLSTLCGMCFDGIPFQLLIIYVFSLQKPPSSLPPPPPIGTAAGVQMTSPVTSPHAAMTPSHYIPPQHNHHHQQQSHTSLPNALASAAAAAAVQMKNAQQQQLHSGGVRDASPQRLPPARPAPQAPYGYVCLFFLFFKHMHIHALQLTHQANA